jgi:hypothetical protein
MATLAELAVIPNQAAYAPAAAWTPRAQWLNIPELQYTFYARNEWDNTPKLPWRVQDYLMNELPLDKPLEEVVVGIRRTGGLQCGVCGLVTSAGSYPTPVRTAVTLSLPDALLAKVITEYSRSVCSSSHVASGPYEPSHQAGPPVGDVLVILHTRTVPGARVMGKELQNAIDICSHVCILTAGGLCSCQKGPWCHSTLPTRPWVPPPS